MRIGDPAPDFTLSNQGGTDISLSSFKGSRVVIYFYPKDNTPGCTKEACNFRDNWNLLESSGIQVLGISKDDSNSHLKFINKYELPFTLLTDLEPCPVATSYESYGLKKFMGKEYDGIHRITFVINEQGNIERVFTKVKTKEHANQILESYK